MPITYIRTSPPTINQFRPPNSSSQEENLVGKFFEKLNLGLLCALGVFLLLLQYARSKRQRRKDLAPYRPFGKLEVEAAKGDFDAQHQLVTLLEYCSREKVEDLESLLKTDMSKLNQHMKNEEYLSRHLQLTSRELSKAKLPHNTLDNKSRVNSNHEGWTGVKQGKPRESVGSSDAPSAKHAASSRFGSWRVSNSIHPAENHKGNSMVPKLDFAKLK